MASPSSSGSAATPAANLPGSSQLLFHAPIQPRTGSDTGSNGLSSESSDTNPDDDLVRRITGKRLAENGAIEYKVVYAASTGKADDWVMEYDLGCPERINDFEKEDWLSDPTSAVSRYINSDLMPYALVSDLRIALFHGSHQNCRQRAATPRSSTSFGPSSSTRADSKLTKDHTQRQEMPSCASLREHMRKSFSSFAGDRSNDASMWTQNSAARSIPTNSDT